MNISSSGGREILRTVSLPFAVRTPDIGTMSLPGIETGGGIGLMTRNITGTGSGEAGKVNLINNSKYSLFQLQNAKITK